MKWFRFYHEAYKNPKIKRMRPELFKFWVQLLCVASDSPDRGTIESADHLACAMGLRLPLVDRLTRELAASNLLVISASGSLTPYHWSERQPDGDDAAKRKKNYRDKTCVESKSDGEPQLSRDVSENVPPLELELDDLTKVKSECENVTPIVVETNLEQPKSPILNPVKTENPKTPTPRTSKWEPTIFRANRPEKVAPDTWEGWMQVRKLKECVDSQQALNMACNQLKKHESNGYLQEDVVQRAVNGSWKGIPKDLDKYSSGGGKGFGGAPAGTGRKEYSPWTNCVNDRPAGRAS